MYPSVQTGVAGGNGLGKPSRPRIVVIENKALQAHRHLPRSIRPT